MVPSRASSNSVPANMSSSSAPSRVNQGPALESHAKTLADRGRLLWWCLALLVALGTLGLSPQLMFLWDIWTTDPLRSIGMLIVLASVVLLLR
jgi:hypothetical protein